MDIMDATLECSVIMATAHLNLVILARTAIVASACKVSVWTTLAPNNLVAPVWTEFLVKPEWSASRAPLKLAQKQLTQLPATFLPEEAALYLATFASLASVFWVVTLVLPLLVNLALTSHVRPWGWAVQWWQLGKVITIATRHACFSQIKCAQVTGNAPLVIANNNMVRIMRSVRVLVLALLWRWSGGSFSRFALVLL